MSTIRPLVTVVFLLAFAAASPASAPEEERLEAWKVDHEIGRILLSGERDLIDWARMRWRSPQRTLAGDFA